MSAKASIWTGGLTAMQSRCRPNCESSNTLHDRHVITTDHLQEVTYGLSYSALFRWPSVTFKVIHLSQAFSKAIFRTVVQHFSHRHSICLLKLKYLSVPLIQVLQFQSSKYNYSSLADNVASFFSSANNDILLKFYKHFVMPRCLGLPSLEFYTSPIYRFNLVLQDCLWARWFATWWFFKLSPNTHARGHRYKLIKKTY